MIKREVAQRYEIPIVSLYEDSAVLYKYYDIVNSIVVVEQEMYYYRRQRQGSITSTSYTAKKQKDEFLVLTERFEYLMEKRPNIREKVISGYIGDIIKAIQNAYRSQDDELIKSPYLEKLEGELEKYIKEIDKNTLFYCLTGYRAALLFLFLQNRDVFRNNIEELYVTRHEKNVIDK